MRHLMLAAAIAALPAAATAHDFLVVPQGPATAGASLPVRVLMTEDHLKPERTPPIDAVDLELVTPEGQQPLELATGETWLDAAAPVPEGPFVLAGTMIRDRMQTPRNRPGEPKAEPCATRSADYSKTFVNLGENDGFWKQGAGLRLELMPQENPADLAAGDTLFVRVMFDGKPVAARVQATYDGHGGGFPVSTHSDADGLAQVTFDRSGLWVVRAKFAAEGQHEAYRCFDGSTNMVLTID